LICILKFYNETYVEFEPGDCDYAEGDIIQVRALCDEGYSEEEDVTIYDDPDATTTIPDGCDYECLEFCVDDEEPPICFEGILHDTEGCGEMEVCCEMIPVECGGGGTTEPSTTTQALPCPYACCEGLSEYETKHCPTGEFCCSDNSCKEDCNAKSSSKIWVIIVIVLIAGAVGFLIYYMTNLKAKSPSLEEF